jgi:copper resistance protein B
MKRLAFFVAASAFASPALAQHEQHEQHEHQPPSAEAPAEDPHAHHRMAEPDPHAAHRGEEADPHAAHSVGAGSGADPHAGHSMPPPIEAEDPHAAHRADTAPEQADPHAGHATPAETGDDPHAGHRMEEDPHAGHDTTHTAVDPPIIPPGPAAFTGPEHAADLHFGSEAMASARAEMYRMHGAIPAYRVLVDRLEARIGSGHETYALDAQAWYGGDIDKLWLKLEAHGEFGGEFEGAEMQALWSHAIGPFFDLQTGVRFDAGPGPNRTHLVLGVQGLAPYWIEVEAAAFLSDKGDLTARIEAEHDALITQRLILQPRVEAEFAAQDIPAQRVGAGLTQVAAGVRLRYQVTQLFAPYVGLEYERAFGETRRLRRLAGEDRGGLSLLAGVRFWF